MCQGSFNNFSVSYLQLQMKTDKYIRRNIKKISPRIFTENSKCQIDETFKTILYNQEGNEPELLPITFEVEARKWFQVKTTKTKI